MRALDNGSGALYTSPTKKTKMATKKNKRRREKGLTLTNLTRNARRLAGADPDDPRVFQELRSHFQDRDLYVSRDSHIGDYVDLTPMSLTYGVRDIEELYPEPLTTRQERATAKGRRIEQKRRDGIRSHSETWNGFTRLR